MKKIFIAIFLFGIIINNYSQSIIYQRGVIRMVYGGDTLNAMFLADTNYYIGNNKNFKFNGVVLIDSLRVGSPGNYRWISSNTQLGTTYLAGNGIILDEDTFKLDNNASLNNDNIDIATTEDVQFTSTDGDSLTASLFLNTKNEKYCVLSYAANSFGGALLVNRIGAYYLKNGTNQSAKDSFEVVRKYELDSVSINKLPIVGENINEGVFKLSTSTDHNNYGLVDLYTNLANSYNLSIGNYGNTGGGIIIQNGLSDNNTSHTGLFIENHGKNDIGIWQVNDSSGHPFRIDQYHGYASPTIMQIVDIDSAGLVRTGWGLKDSLITNAQARALIGGYGFGTVSSITAGNGLTGGTITTTGTIEADTTSSKALATKLWTNTIFQGSSSIATLGTINTGIWHGTAIDTAYSNAVSNITATSPLSIQTYGKTRNISIPVATGSISGYLTSTDWTTFNNKQAALTNPITGNGSGTDNQLVTYTGTNAVQNEATLTYNGTSLVNSNASGYIASPQFFLGTSVANRPIWSNSGSGYFCLNPNQTIGWSATANVGAGSDDLELGRVSAGVLGIYNAFQRSGIGSLLAGNINSDGTASRDYGINANTTSNTAGNTATFHGGAATSGATDKDGGMAVIAPGASTGTAKASVRIQRLTRSSSTGTSYNTLVDAHIIPSVKVATSESSINLFEISLPSGAMAGGYITFQVTATDGTELQVHSGHANYAAVNKGGVYTMQIQDESTSDDANAGSSGVITDTWAITSGTDKITISVTVACSLIIANDIRIYYTIHNGSAQSITQL